MCGRVGRFYDAHPFAAAFDGVLRNQNSRLGQQADQHDHTRLQIDVILQSEYLGEQERAHQSEWYGEDNGKRYEETFVETSQNQIDQEDTDGVDENRLRTAAACLFACHTAIFVSVTHRQRFCGHFLNHFLHFTRRVTVGRIHIGCDGAVEVETVGRFRSQYLFQCNELAHRSHFRTVAHKHIVQCLLVQTIFGRCLHHYTIYLTVLVVVGDICSTAITAYRIEYRAWRNSCTLTFGGIHFYRELREVDGVGCISHSHFRALVQGIEELCGRVIERSQITACHILKVQFEGVTHTVSRNHGGLETEYLRFLDGLELCVEAGSYGIRTVFLSFSFAPVFQADNDRTVRSSLTGDQTVSCYAGVVFYFGRIFQNVFQPVHYFRCLFERASR